MRASHLVFCALFHTASGAMPSTEVSSSFVCKIDGNQQEMNACAISDYKAADALLNQHYKIAIARLSQAKRETLKQEQRTWLKNRDPKCKAEAKSSEGGSIWQLEYFSCLWSATELRTKVIVKSVEQP